MHNNALNESPKRNLYNGGSLWFSYELFLVDFFNPQNTKTPISTTVVELTIMSIVSAIAPHHVVLFFSTHEAHLSHSL